jgi:small-conductance mechanosensitive channel
MYVMNITEESILNAIFGWLVSHGIKIAGIIVVTLFIQSILTRFVSVLVSKAIERAAYTDPDGESKREKTMNIIFQNLGTILLWVISAVMIVSELGVDIAPLLAAAGVAGVALGFGGQFVVRDIIAGFFIIIENQFRVGDIIKVGEQSGVVEDISLRMTTLRNLDGVVHHIPNGKTDGISNMTKAFSRINIDVGIAYDSKLDHVIEVVNRVGESMSKDELWGEDIIKTPRFLRVNDFADSAIIVKILGETKPARQWAVAGELRMRLKIAFDKEGIIIPFPQQVNHNSK